MKGMAHEKMKATIERNQWAVQLHLPDSGVPGRDSSEKGVELRARTGAGTVIGV